MNNENIVRLFNEISNSYKESFLKDYAAFIKNRNKMGNVYIKNKPFKVIQQPNFFGVDELDEFVRFGKGVFDIVNKIYYLYNKNEEIKNLFNLDDSISGYINTPQDYSVNFPIARLDIFYTSEKELMLCEINADGAGGLHKDTILNSYFNTSKVCELLKKNYKLQTFDAISGLVKNCLDIYSNFNIKYGFPKNPNIGILNFQETNNVEESMTIKKYFEMAGARAFVIAQDDLSYDNDGAVLYNGTQLHMIFKEAINERLINEYNDFNKFIHSMSHNKICVIGNIKSELFDSKILFSILHSEKLSKYLTDDELSFIRKYIPYTISAGSESERLYEEIIAKRHDYVLKCVDSYQSRGVYVGKAFSDKDWIKLISTNWNNKHIIQKYVETAINTYTLSDNNDIVSREFKTIVGLFYYNEQFSGLFSRAGSDFFITGANNTDYHLGNVFYSDPDRREF